MTLPRIEHIVIVVMENRSFDHIEIPKIDPRDDSLGAEIAALGLVDRARGDEDD